MDLFEFDSVGRKPQRDNFFLVKSWFQTSPRSPGKHEHKNNCMLLVNICLMYSFIRYLRLRVIQPGPILNFSVHSYIVHLSLYAMYCIYSGRSMQTFQSMWSTGWSMYQQHHCKWEWPLWMLEWVILNRYFQLACRWIFDPCPPTQENTGLIISPTYFNNDKNFVL